MDMTMQEAINLIDGQPNTPFIIHFTKADGTIRQMVAVKRNRHKSHKTGKADERSKFKYWLNEKNALLVDELTAYITTKKHVKGMGTVHQLKERPDVNQIILNNQRKLPITIKIHSIIEINGNKVWA